MKIWAAAVLSAALLELPFPLAGPMPPWRSIFAWFGLVPLLWAILSPVTVEHPRPLRRAFLISYLCGVLWYMGNCYWVRDTMMHYGDMPTGAPILLLIGFSLVLGLYFGLFGLGVMLVRRATGKANLALVAAPFLWVALDLAAARITSVPWDQLGYSQVDNGIVNQLAPWTGVYGITFLLVAANALSVGVSLAAEQMKDRVARLRIQSWGFAAYLAILFVVNGHYVLPAEQPAVSATAVLIQPNLDVGGDNDWASPGEWDTHIAQFEHLASEQCKTYIAGIPQTGAGNGEIICPPYPTHPDLIVWPEAPAPFFENDPRFQRAMATIVESEKAPLIVSGIGSNPDPAGNEMLDHVSAMVFAADGQEIGRYDKIHLVPFGEFVPFPKLLFFAHKLTGAVSRFTPGTERTTFRRLNGHSYGVFICYEAVFADEVRHFAQLGAEVLVNISDDGWYGDTSAPWQHLNMARMRAIENRRWLLRDTNNGITAVIDPYGRVRQSIPRHQVDALPAQYGFRDEITFYTAHGDVFAWLCVLLSIVVLAWSGKSEIRRIAARDVS
ncbi:MAG: apolipoprotein N-acyltransferase [Terracidiphilus sp.]